MMRASRTARFLLRFNGMVDADRARKRREPKLRRESKSSTCKSVLHAARCTRGNSSRLASKTRHHISQQSRDASHDRAIDM
jgi:hypothetical protein